MNQELGGEDPWFGLRANQIWGERKCFEPPDFPHIFRLFSPISTSEVGEGCICNDPFIPLLNTKIFFLPVLGSCFTAGSGALLPLPGQPVRLAGEPVAGPPLRARSAPLGSAVLAAHARSRGAVVATYDELLDSASAVGRAAGPPSALPFISSYMYRYILYVKEFLSI